MDKKDLLSTVSNRANVTQKNTARVLEAYGDVIKEELVDYKYGGRNKHVLVLRSNGILGRIKFLRRQEKPAFNFSTNEPMTVPERIAIKIELSGNSKKQINRDKR